MIYAGVDTHKDFHVLVILDSLGRPVSSGSFSASEEGYKRLAKEIGDPSGCLAVGMEGTTSYGAGLCSYLMKSGYAVFEVLRPKKEKRRIGEGKTDSIDAERAARAVAAGKGVVPKSHNGWVEGLRALTVARSIHVSAMTSVANAVGSLLVSAPEQVRAKYGPLKGAGLYRKLGSCRPNAEDDVAGPLLASLKALARTWLELDEKASQLEGAMRRLIEAKAPALLQARGCGAANAAELAISAGDNPERIPSEAKFRFDLRRVPHPRPRRKDRRAQARPRREQAGQQSSPHDRRKQDERGRENARLHGEAQVRRQDGAGGHALPEEIHSQGDLLDVAAPHEVEVRPGRGSCGDEKIARPDPAADRPRARSAECEAQ